MPRRIRVIAQNKEYGLYLNARAFTIIEHLSKAEKPQIKPVRFPKWPRWKRAVWLAAKLPNWKFRVFREAKGTRASRSLFWQEVQKFGGEIPYKLPKKKLPVPRPQRVPDFRLWQEAQRVPRNWYQQEVNEL